MAELEIKPTAAMRLHVTTLIGVALAIVFLLVWLLTGGGAGLFARKTDLRTFMPDATGLGVGAPVRVNGIQVGEVKHITISGALDLQRAVRVDLRVETKYVPGIPADSVTGINADTLIGDKFVDIDTGKSAVPVAEDGELRSQPAEQASDRSDLIHSMQDSMKAVDDMLQQVSSPTSQIGRYVVGEKEYDQLLRTVNTFDRSMGAALAPDNAAGKALFTMDLFNKVQKPLLQIDATMQAIQNGKGPLGRLYASDEQYNTLLKQMGDLRKTLRQIRSDMAAEAPKLRDDTAYKKIQVMLASTDAMIDALNRGEGKAGELLNNPQLYESLTLSLKNLDAFLHDFQDNPRKYMRLKIF